MPSYSTMTKDQLISEVVTVNNMIKSLESHTKRLVREHSKTIINLNRKIESLNRDCTAIAGKNEINYYTKSQICKMILNEGKPLSRATLNEWIADGDIKTFKLGGREVITKDEWVRFKGGCCD